MQRIFEHQARVGAACALAIALVATGTGSALGQGEAPVTLRLAVADDSNRPSFVVVEAFVEAVSELSDGSVTIEPRFDASADFEVGTARLLMDGTADLAVTASRAWDEVGVDSFTALQAPFLIDNDALAEAVADSDTARAMLDSARPHGIVGLELWPEDLRHPAIYPDCADPITTPGSFAGLNVRAIPSRVTYDLLESLGANPSFDDWDLECAQDATESGLRQGASLPFGVVFTGDVTFFPKYQVLAANAAVFDRLTEQQRAVIRDAAAIAQDMAIATHPTDAEAAEAFCQEDGTVVLAGPEGVAAFQAAAQPVLDQLATDAIAAEAIEAIAALKRTIAPAAGAIACGSASVPATVIEAATGPTPIDGTYVTHLSFEELANSPLLYDAGEVNDGNWGDITFTFDAGTFTVKLTNPTEDYESSGPYNVEGDLLTMFDQNACCPPEPFSFRWSLDGDVLTLMRHSDYVGPTPYVAKPFTRIPEGSSTAASPDTQ